MSIAKFAVTRPVTVVMRIAAFLLLGIVCLLRLPVDLLPKVTLPTIGITTQWPNVAPEEIEAQITRPIERAVSAVPNMYQVTSSSTEGVSSVRVEFQWGADIGQAAVDVLQVVERARRLFPNDPTIQSPTISKFDPNQMPILTFGVSGEEDPVKLRTMLDNEISPMIDAASGVASTRVTGGHQRAIIVDVDPDRMRARNITLADIMRRITQENLNLPAGVAKQGETEYMIRSFGWFANPAEIAQIPIKSYDGQIVVLSDVADVRDATPEVRLNTRLNGEPAGSLVVTKQSEANTISTARAVHEKVARVKELYPNLDFRVAYDQSRFIESAVNHVRDSAIIGGILAVLVLLFFLRNVRSTLVVAMSIPTSIISTFALLYMCGFTINTMSLGGLALATGLIVDDAVVVLENIFRHIERDKKSALEAAVSGTNEIMSAVVASTWTVMVVFLPLLLIKGQAGQMFTQFALVVIFSIAVSLLDATTTVPMLATRFISGEAHAEKLSNMHGHSGPLMRAFALFGRWFDSLDASYRNGLRWAIHHRLTVIAGAIIITGASFLVYPMIGTELMPMSDSGDFSIGIKLPVGTAFSTTDRTMRQVEDIVLGNPDVETVLSTAGSQSTRGSSTSLTPNQGSMTVKLRADREGSTQRVMADLRKQLGRVPGIRPRLTQTDIVARIMTGGNQTIEVDIFGDDLDTLSQLARQAMGLMGEVPGLEGLDVNWQDAMPEVKWKVDRKKALQLAVSFSDIASTIGTATNGSITTYYQEKGYQYPIIVQMPENRRKTVSDIQNLAVGANAAGSNGRVLLGQVATPVYDLGPSEITRMDRRRYVAISGMPMGRSSGDVESDIRKSLTGFQAPAGYYWDWGTTQKRQAEEFQGIGLAVILAIGLIYMLLASQFESFVHPLTILFSVPLAATGVILALFITNRSFGLTALIGILMLVGIVVKNGILLVDYTNVLRRRGMNREEALLLAGPTRLRPILMTASATVLGMLPLALGLGEGSEVQAPMATVVIGGLITSTALTLFVVPTAYSILDEIALRLRRERE